MPPPKIERLEKCIGNIILSTIFVNNAYFASYVYNESRTRVLDCIVYYSKRGKSARHAAIEGHKQLVDDFENNRVFSYRIT